MGKRRARPRAEGLPRPLGYRQGTYLEDLMTSLPLRLMEMEFELRRNFGKKTAWVSWTNRKRQRLGVQKVRLGAIREMQFLNFVVL